MERKDAHDFKSIHDAAMAIRKGGVVVYPTDTAYGLGCDPLNPEALKMLYKIKQRNESMPFPVIAANSTMVKQWCEWTPEAARLAKEYWPGPLTIILTIIRPLPRELTGMRTTLAIRVPSHEVSKALSRRIGRPIVSTSANISGSKELFDPEDVLREFGDNKEQPTLFLDDGVLPTSKPSTIVDLTKGSPYIVRKGAIALELQKEA